MKPKKNYSNNSRNEKCVLLLGGLGFIGSHISRALLKEGYQVKIFDKLYGSKKLISDIRNQVDVIEGDAEKTEDIMKAFRDVDILIDLIHTTVPGSSMQNPAYDVRSNVVSTVNWLYLINQTNIKRVIYISSGGTVYGIPLSNPIGEHHPTNPICSYGITKLTIEKYIAMFSDLYGIEYRICRPSNVYGEGQWLNIGQGVIGVFLERALKKIPIEIWGDGTNRRDYLYVTDLVDGIAKLLRHEGKERVFNISTGIGYSLNDIISIIREKLKLDAAVKYMPYRGFDVSDNVLENKLLKSEIGWEPKTDLVEGIEKVYNWLRAQ